MKMSYTDLQNTFLRNIGKEGSTDTTLIADFKQNLSQRYQMVLAKMQNYMTQVPKTASTVANQQYYSYPVGIVNIEAIKVTVSSVDYELQEVNSQTIWNNINSIDFVASTYPQFFFPRRDDFGIWPIPQAVYTITFDYHIRDRDLTIADYTTGTVTVVNGSATVEGSGTTWTNAMKNRWFQLTSETSDGQGYWYRIASVTDADTLVLDNYWDGLNGNTYTYRIGQVPEIPDEGHIILADGTTSDFYAGIRSDIEKATWFNNKFWTGDGNNSTRDEGDEYIAGGLIGLMARYGDRNSPMLINRRKTFDPPAYKMWGQSIT